MNPLACDDFRNQCLSRDNGKCVFCGKNADYVHHVLERRLFPDGGYYKDNGISVCEDHHRDCEMTLINVEEARLAAGITQIILPPDAYDDQVYTKWLDPILADGRRSPGPLFWDESVQRILREGGVLGLYTTYVRYPRTYHVPFSPGRTKDDRALDEATFRSAFAGKRVIVSEKLDGESSTFYPDGYFHARSPDGSPHPSQSRIRAWAAAHAYEIPQGWRVCLENLQAVHSIAYERLPAHFVLLSIWDQQNACLPYDATAEWAHLLGVPMPPVLYDGPFDETILRGLWRERDARGDLMEGWVVRTAEPFFYKDFKYHVAKFVRASHVQAGAHNWRRGRLVENRLDDTAQPG